MCISAFSFAEKFLDTKLEFMQQLTDSKKMEALGGNVMKQYIAPELVKIDFLMEDVLDNSIIDAGDVDDPIEMGPAIDIFG